MKTQLTSHHEVLIIRYIPFKLTMNAGGQLEDNMLCKLTGITQNVKIGFEVGRK